MTMPSRPVSRYAAPAVGALVVLVALAILGNPSGQAARLAPVGSGSPTPSPASTAPQPTPLSLLSPTGATTTGRVTKVIDGDTIIVSIGGKPYHVRYIGMDTPEDVKPNTPVQFMSKEAAAANAALVAGRTVTLERDVSETDRYGRLLRDVWVDRGGHLVLVGLELVRTGFAHVTTYPPDVKYVDELLAAERSARSAEIGLWRASNPPKMSP